MAGINGSGRSMNSTQEPLCHFKLAEKTIPLMSMRLIVRITQPKRIYVGYTRLLPPPPPPAATKEEACLHLSPPSRSADVRGSVNRPRSATAPRPRTFPTPGRFRHPSPSSGSRERYLDKMETTVVSGRRFTRWLDVSPG